MKNRNTYSILLFCLLLILSSCESEAGRKIREAREEQQKIEMEKESLQKEEQRKIDSTKIAVQQEKERLLKIRQDSVMEVVRAERIEKERIREKYINNSLRTGATPYSYCFGRNKTCSVYGCSQIKVRTPSNSDVMVTIKKNDEVFRHAYINAGNQYTFEFPNGVYQAFFYYGKGWNPDKEMKETDCGMLKGGFVADEQFSKDSPQTLNNSILEYELILQERGNFSTKPSNSDEAF